MKRNVTESLNDWKSSANRKPLILRGARQVGKTYILKEFGSAAFPRCHYVNFEKDERLGRIFEQDLKPDRILDELQFYLDQIIDRRQDLVIFDEIQRYPQGPDQPEIFLRGYAGIGPVRRRIALGCDAACGILPGRKSSVSGYVSSFF